MLLIEWFKNLKWIVAIRSYDSLIKAVNAGLDVAVKGCELVKYNLKLERRIQELEEDNERLKKSAVDDRVRDLQAILAQHRQAAQQAIRDAENERNYYERKIKELNAENPSRPPQ